ncbi:MAG: InlB B-repeat-containing protein, partial [Prevotellaceae bacterium]|nr:InlB B-repeat-containing protein [Prevotellaceae bacterium]
GAEITLPPGTVITVDDDGRVTVAPGDGGATVTNPGDGSTTEVPGDGSEIIIDPAHPGDGVRPVFVLRLAHLSYPYPMRAVYNGAAQPVAVTPADGVAGMGAITVKYDGSTTAPTNAGVYSVTADIAASRNYKAASGMALGNYTIAKAAGAAVVAPTLAGKTHSSITVNAIADAANGQTIEYAIAETAGSVPTSGWQSGTTFTGLEASHTYYIYARAAEDANREAGAAQVGAAVATDEGITGVTVSPAAVSVRKGATQTFAVAVTGGASVPKTAAWSIATPVGTGTTIDGAGLLTVAADESASSLTVRVASTFDPTRYAEATVSLYAKTETGSGASVATPPGGDPIDNGDGAVTLPDGGAITLPDGKADIALPPGTVIDGDGRIVVPPGNGGTATCPDTGAEITLPPGTVIDGDGRITLPDAGDGKLTHPDSGAEITLPPGTVITVDDDGRVTVAPGDGGATVTNPGDGSTVEVPGDGSEIIIDPAHPGDGVRPVFVPRLAHLSYPYPMRAVYNGAAQPVAVTPADGVAGMGAITVKYDGSTTAPTNAGVYSVTADIAASRNYKAASDLPLGNYIVAKADIAAVWSNTTLAYSGGAQSPTAVATGVHGEDIALTVAGAQTEIGTGYTATADFVTPSANYTLTNVDVEFAITVNPNYNYTVNFDSRGGSAANPQAVKYGNRVTEPVAPVRRGYTFDGWFSDSTRIAGGEWNFATDLIVRDTTLYAAWNLAPLHEAELVAITVNHNPVPLGDGDMSYMAACGEGVATVEMTAPPRVRIFVNGAESDAVTDVPLTGEVTNIRIAVRSESGANTANYTLKVASALSGDKLYFRRWGDVLAVNHNPETNGGRTVTGVRWYRNDNPVGTGRFVSIAGDISAYRAEAELDGVWHRICPYQTAKSVTGVTAYPNPASRDEIVTLELPEHFVGGTLSIYSVSGTLVKKDIALTGELTGVSVAGLDAGIYLFRAIAPDGDGESATMVIR